MIFSPYLDRLAVSLLEQCPLPAAQIAVVTDLSPASGNQDYRAQLLAIKRLLKRGVQVRSLARLHAKVLLVDGQTVTVGSQNFTSYARSSKEVTADPRTDLRASSLIKELRTWQRQSEEVSLTLIERLLDNLVEPLRQANEANERLEHAIATELAHERALRFRASLEREREAALRTNLAATLDSSVSRNRFRAPQQSAYGSIRTKWSQATNSPYQTLEASRLMDFTRWWDTGSTPWTVRGLTPFNFYPIILRPTGRMALGRVTKTRITFLWLGVQRAGQVDGRRLWATVNFPAAPTGGANVILSLKPSEKAGFGCRLHFLYDGSDVNYVSDETWGPAADYTDQFHGRCMQALEADRGSLLSLIFREFDPNRVGIREHNAENFFTRDRYQLDLVAQGKHPVLIATPL